eukprot:2855479-Amphidinium_carterae.1
MIEVIHLITDCAACKQCSTYLEATELGRKVEGCNANKMDPTTTIAKCSRVDRFVTAQGWEVLLA